ncbi:MAG: small multi-drug export protein [Lachnospiraceae bacterium]|nr:small multi-drug export protein [Lachnospiraceae bacterium]MBR4816245.1 small multi-drug export protein [Lachnospiraceae bacterium]
MISVKKTGKVLVILLILTFLVMIMTACSKSNNETNTADNTETTQTVTDAEVEEAENSFAGKLAGKLAGLPDELVCFIISMVPIIELRGGLIIAAIKGIPLFRAIGVCIAGNIIPVPFILLLITPIFTWLKKTKLFKPMVEKLETKSMGKSDKIKKYEFVGLMLFVGIPLPGTGAWTGSLIASLLNIKFKKAFPAVVLGLFMATAIMCIISYGIPWIIANVF